MWYHVCLLFLVYEVATAQELTNSQQSNKLNGASDNLTPLHPSSSQPTATPNEGNITPQSQLNSLLYQNNLADAANSVPPGLAPFGAGFQPGLFNNGAFGGFNPLLGGNGFPLPQNVPPQFPTSFKELRIPQPYPVYINKPVPVQIPVRIPVEIPKPYPVQVPHPVPVPVHIRVPVPVEKPYPIPITKTVAIPVEKPVYIKVPQVITEPIPHLYPNIPQNLPEGLQQFGLQFGVNPGQGIPQEIQIGGGLQAEGREGGQLGVAQSSIPNFGASIGGGNVRNTNINPYTTHNPNLLAGEVQKGIVGKFGSSAPNSNEVPSRNRSR